MKKLSNIRHVITILAVAAGLMLINILLVPAWIIKWTASHAVELMAAVIPIGFIIAWLWASAHIRLG